jgi:glycosyltransferase involved in cell wall biosynthesis
MRLVSLCHNVLPAHFTNTEQLVWTFTELARLGHDVEVLCRKSGATGAALREHIAGYYGLDALPHSIDFVPVGPAGVEGPLHEGTADVLNVARAWSEKHDVVHTRDVFALTLALAAGLRCVFETYRVDINTDGRFGPWRAFCYTRKNLLGIVAHSHLCRRSFLENGVSEERVTTIHNGYAPAHFTPELTREAARARLNLTADARIATYTGHVDATKGIDILVRIALQLPEVEFLLVGAVPGSAGERTVLQLIQEAGVKNVCLLPRVPQSQIPLYLFASDCLVIPPAAAPLRIYGRTVLPMKTFSYLAAGRPIVAPDLPDLREVLRPDENALLIPPDDVDAAAAAIRLAVLDPIVGERLGSAARRDAAQYTWQARAERVSAFLQKACAAP